MTKSEVIQEYAKRHNLPYVDVKLHRPKRCPKTGRFIAAPKYSVPSEGSIQYSLGENLAEWQRKEVRRLRAWNRFDWCLERLLWAGIGMAILVVAEVIWLRL
jgi:hypothetical protein